MDFRDPGTMARAAVLYARDYGREVTTFAVAARSRMRVMVAWRLPPTSADIVARN